LDDFVVVAYDARGLRYRMDIEFDDENLVNFVQVSLDLPCVSCNAVLIVFFFMARLGSPATCGHHGDQPSSSS
jgi:hypothetical protein